jgi:hypothetical protein
MSMTSVETNAREAANYGGLVDAIGGIVTIVLAIVALSGINSQMLLAISTVVFGAALLIQGGAMLSEYTHMIFPPGTTAPVEEFSGGGLSVVFLVGTAGIVLGVLALVGIYSVPLTAIAVIAFGSALVLSSNAVWNLHRMKQAFFRIGGRPALAGSEVLASEMAAGSAGLQCIAGLAAIVLGILAVTGTNAMALTLISLLILGATILLTGSTLSGAVQGFMRPVGNSPRLPSAWSERPAE